MHDIIHRELQTTRVADFHRRARQDRLEREAARQWRRRAFGRVLGFLMACGFNPHRHVGRSLASPTTTSPAGHHRRARATEGAVLARPAK